MAAIIFIHGAGDSAAVWARQTAVFSKDHEVLAVAALMVQHAVTAANPQPPQCYPVEGYPVEGYLV